MSRVKYKKYLTKDQSEFDHRWACWANNHSGWAKAKRLNKRLAKRKLNRLLDKEQKNEKDSSNITDDAYDVYTCRM